MKHRTASIAVVATLVIGGAAACGDGDDEVAPTPTLTGVEGVSPPPVSPSPTSSIPTLAVGQTINISTSPAQMVNPVPAGAAAVTLDGVRVSTDSSLALDPGDQAVIWTMTVKNTGPDEFDLWPLIQPQRWQQGDRVSDAGSANAPDDVDLLLNQPEPRPGETVTGSGAAAVKKGSGVLEFADRQSVPMFQIEVKAP